MALEVPVVEAVVGLRPHLRPSRTRIVGTVPNTRNAPCSYCAA
jgi:hypothetical protein